MAVQALWPVLAGFLGAVVVPLAQRIMVGIGVGIATFAGISQLLERLRELIMDQFVGLPLEVLDFLGLLQVDRAITMILSAVTIRFVLRGLDAGGVLRKPVWKGAA
ncbi:MAG: DUF2523 domain-containing protein [Chromatiales bacterium]|nr:DUF2523 domain-containing protein [Chromatiales bacterium]